jgi:hypothetical protein
LCYRHYSYGGGSWGLVTWAVAQFHNALLLLLVSFLWLKYLLLLVPLLPILVRDVPGMPAVAGVPPAIASLSAVFLLPRLLLCFTITAPEKYLICQGYAVKSAKL